MRNRGATALLLGGLFLVPAGAMGQSTHMAYAPNVSNAKAEYVVFLDNDSGQLSSAASSTVRRAANAARSARTVHLVGRADHVEAVKQELIRDGMPERVIVARPEPTRAIVRVRDGVSDPLSRRVEIAF